MSRIEAVYTATRNLYPYLMASVQSLLDHNPDARVWMLIEDDSLGYEPPKNVEIVNASMQKIFDKRSCVNWSTQFTYMSLLRTAYSKLFTGEQNDCGVKTLPKLDKILQLDVDTIICDSFQPLWETDIEGKWFAAVEQFPADYRPWGRNKYYNVGVCLFNLDQIRKDGADDKAIKMCNERRMQYIDEMAWNKLNNEQDNTKGVDLDARYNQMMEVEQTLDAACIHYAGTKFWWKDIEKQYRGHYLQKYSQYFKTGVSS